MRCDLPVTEPDADVITVSFDFDTGDRAKLSEERIESEVKEYRREGAALFEAISHRNSLVMGVKEDGKSFVIHEEDLNERDQVAREAYLPKEGEEVLTRDTIIGLGEVVKEDKVFFIIVARRDFRISVSAAIFKAKQLILRPA